MKFYLMALVFALLSAGFLVVHTSKQQTHAEETHVQQQIDREDAMEANNQAYTAKFLLYTNGTQRILSAKKYILQAPEAYLRPEAPTHVRVGKQGTTWGQFFESISVQINPTCLVLSQLQQFCEDGAYNLKFYLNGVKDPEVLTKEIHDGDLLLVSYGAENQIELDKQIQSVAELK